MQLYVAMPSTSDLTHAPLQLRAFKKVKDLAPGTSETITLRLDKYAVSYWEERISRWVVEDGEYTARIGRSSAPEDLTLAATFKIEKGFEWSGL